MTGARTIQRPVFLSALFCIVIAPAGFGGATDWFTSVFAVSIGALALIWAISVAFRSDLQPASIRPIAVPVMLYATAVIWCFGQAKFGLAPDITHMAWRNAGSLLGTSPITPLSLDPEASLNGGLHLTAYALVFLLFYQFGTDEKRAVRMLSALAGAGGTYALYGIYLELTDAETVLGYVRTFEHGNLSSTFPNRNAFASYASICLIGCFTLLYRRRLRMEDLTGRWSERLVAFLRYFIPRNGWIFLSCIVLFSAILMTHSRAGLLTAIIAICGFMACATWGIQFKRLAVAGGIAMLAVVSALSLIGGGQTSARFEKARSASAERMEIYSLTAKAIADRPYLGTGLGTFSDVFAQYRSPDLRPTIDFAHNSYLENALEMGIPAAITFYAALAGLMGLFFRALISNRAAQPYPALGIAVMSAAAIHAACDYAVQFPAVSVTLAAMTGIAAAQSVARRADLTPPGVASTNRRNF